MNRDSLYPDSSLPEHFERTVREHGNLTAVFSDSAELTYAELNRRANILAHRLLQTGGARGDRVAILMTQDVPSFAAMLGTQKAGRVLVILNPEDPLARLRELAADCEPGAILTDTAHRDLAANVRPNLPVICADDPWREVPDENPVGAAGLDDLAMLIYTSGTTGRPKAAMQTHGHIIRNARANVRQMGCTHEDRIALVASLWGGQGNNTAWTSFSCGAGLYSYPANVNGVTNLAAFMIGNRVTCYFSAASLFRHFMKTIDPGTLFRDVRVVKLSADAATWDDFAAFRAHFPNGYLVSMMGASEVGNLALIKLDRDHQVGTGRLPVGRANEGLTISIEDGHGQTCPPDTIGKIVVRSRHMSLGYWRDPELTARHFSSDPDGTQVFRSADLGMVDASGILMLAGRDDATFKIRGQRVDLSEVERGLAGLPDVAVVAAGTGKRSNGELQLIAYVVPVPGSAPTLRRLRTVARASLPEHLVPSVFVLVEQMPRAANGKIDRVRLRSLPLPPLARDTEPPQGDTEALLAAIWEEAFDTEGVGHASDFFDLGGDSLIAAVIAARMHAALGVELNFGSFVDHPVLRDMAAFISRCRRSADVGEEFPMTPADRAKPIPLSPLQETFWHRSRTPANSLRYTRAAAFRIKGKLDIDVLRAGLSDVIARHEVLRTRFPLVGDTPLQVIEPATAADVPIVELDRSLDGEAGARAVLQEEGRHIFDLAGDGPPIRLKLVRLADDSHWLVKCSHHIITDAQSWNVFARDLGEAYAARIAGKPPNLPPLPIQYGDYAVWLRQLWHPEGSRYRSTVDWWSHQLGGIAESELPLRKRGLGRNPEPDDWQVAWGLSPATSKKLDELGYSEAATFYMIRLAGVLPVLAAINSRDDAVVMGIFTNRNRLFFERMLGSFANFVIIALEVPWTATFREFVGRVRTRIGEIQARADLPHWKLVAEMATRGLRVPQPIMVHVVTPHPPMRFAGLELTWEEAAPQMPHGVMIGFNQFEEASGYLHFDVRIFSKDTMSDLCRRLTHFFDAAASAPDTTLAELVVAAGIREPAQ